MTRPVTVRIGILLLSLALIIRAAALLVLIPQTPRMQDTVSVGGEGASLLIYAGIVYALARGNNWARLLFAFAYVTGAMLTIFFAIGNRGLGEFANPLGEVTMPHLILMVLVGAGVACLFLRSAAVWYHRSRRSSLTSA
jgi:hypothetical protein